MSKKMNIVRNIFVLGTLLLSGAFSFSLNANTSETAILVTKMTYADAAVAMSISAQYNIPVFFVNPNNISQNLIETLKNDNISHIILIGGPVVISHNVSEELRSLGFNVTRIWGVTRYETSSYVNMFFFNKSDYAVIVTRDIVNDNDNAFKASILSIADEFAVKNHYPLFITPDGTLSISVATALKDLGVKKVYIFTLESNALGRIPIQLSQLNISYEVYTRDNASEALNNICLSKRIIDIPYDFKWEEIRYALFLGAVLNGSICVFPMPVKNITEFNDTKYKFEYKNLENKVHGLLRVEDLIKLHLDRLLELEKEKLDEINLTCYAMDFDYPICQKLPEIEARINESIQNIRIALNNINETLNLLEEENNYSLDLDNHYGIYSFPLSFGILNRLEHEKKDIEDRIRFEIGGNMEIQMNARSENKYNNNGVMMNMNLSAGTNSNNSIYMNIYGKMNMSYNQGIQNYYHRI